MPLESEEKQGSCWAATGLGWGLPDRDPARVSGHRKERDAVGRAELHAWSACQKRTNRPALLTEAAGAGRRHLRGCESDGASLGAQRGLGFHAISPALPSALPPAPVTWGASLPPASPRGPGCAVRGPWRGCAGRSLGEAESPATMEGRSSAGQDAPESVSLEIPHPGPGGSKGCVPGQCPAVSLPGADCPPILGSAAVSPPI